MESIGSLAERVIQRAATPNRPKSFIFDIDGTIADNSHRVHHIYQDPKDWDSYHKGASKDTLIEPIATVLHCIRRHFDIVFVTGRNESLRKITEEWIERNLELDPFQYELFMRPDLDFRSDIVVKKELFLRDIQEQYDVIAVFEDRARVVDMWRKLGVTALQVSEGNY